MFERVGKDLVLRFPLGPITVALNPATLGASLGISLLLLALALWLRREIPGDPEAPPSRRLALLIALVDFVENQILSGTSEKLRRSLLPLIATLFLFILACNLSAILPIPGMVAPTQDLNVTLGLALLVYLLTHVYGMRTKGVFRHIKSYLEPIPVMLPMNLVGDMGRTLSHGFRLFGNILGGAIMTTIAVPIVSNLVLSYPRLMAGVVGLIVLGIGLVGSRLKKGWAKPVAFVGGVLFASAIFARLFQFTPVLSFLAGVGISGLGTVVSLVLNAFFGIFAGTIQALVFTLLAAAYIQTASE